MIYTISNIKKTSILIGIAVFLLTIDRFLKIIAINGLLDQPINYISDIFRLYFVKNYFIAFSLPINNLVATVISLLIICFLIISVIYFTKKQRFVTIGFLFLILAGASSNLFDRLKYGYVVDYLDLKYFTVFNLADAMIVLGVIGLLLFINKKY